MAYSLNLWPSKQISHTLFDFMDNNGPLYKEYIDMYPLIIQITPIVFNQKHLFLIISIKFER